MPRQSISPSLLPAAERQCRSKLHLLLNQAEGFLHGSLIIMARRCGKPSCRCAADDNARHESLYLGQTLGSKTTMIYVPARLERTVRQWHDNFQQAEQLIEQLSQQGRARLGQAKAAKAVKATNTSASHKAPQLKPPRKPS
jgi:hypothetical protein